MSGPRQVVAVPIVNAKRTLPSQFQWNDLCVGSHMGDSTMSFGCVLLVPVGVTTNPGGAASREVCGHFRNSAQFHRPLRLIEGIRK